MEPLLKLSPAPGLCLDFCRNCIGVPALGIALALSVSGCKKTAPPAAAGPGGTVASSSGADSAAGTGGAASSGSSDGAAAPGSLADRLNAVHNEGASEKTVIKLPDWKPVSSATSSMQIPFVNGLVQTGAITDKYGDHESVRTIKDITPKTASFVLTNDITVQDPKTGKILSGDQNSTTPPKRVTGTRIIDLPDMANTHRLMAYFQTGKTEHFPGSIPLGASAEVINQLRAGRPSQFDFQADPQTTLAMQFKGHAELIEVQTNWNGHFMYKCELKRVGTTDLSFPVLVNGERVELPVLHASCPQGGDDEAHFYFLDQPSNALLLATVISSLEANTQMIKIDFPTGPAADQKGPTPMEQALSQKEKVEVYGIYFDFDSSTIKPESETVLKQIAGILLKNPGWKLSVAGHTDNVGEAAFNQGLSERRAAAVKNALVTEYKIGTDRLTTSGFGASQPIEPNTTVEGRARNRRVELQRQ